MHPKVLFNASPRSLLHCSSGPWKQHVEVSPRPRCWRPVHARWLSRQGAEGRPDEWTPEAHLDTGKTWDFVRMFHVLVHVFVTLLPSDMLILRAGSFLR